MISHARHCIFVHIPKTGGTSIEDVIWPKPRRGEDLWMGFIAPGRNKYQTGGLQHLLARQIRIEVGGDVFTRYFKFSIIRNPWDRVISQYSYLKQRPDLQDYFGVKADAPLAQYLAAISRSDHVQVMPQLNFLRDGNGTMLVDLVGRFETLAQDAREIFRRIGIDDAVMPHEAKSDRRSGYRDYYDDETRERVTELYAEDIAHFGYAF